MKDTKKQEKDLNVKVSVQTEIQVIRNGRVVQTVYSDKIRKQDANNK